MCCSNYRPVGEMSESDSDDEPPAIGDKLFKSKKSNLKIQKMSDGVEVVPKEDMNQKHKKAVRFADGLSSDSDSDEELMETNEKDMEDSDSGVDAGNEDAAMTRLTTDLVGDKKELKRERRAENWFSQVIGRCRIVVRVLQGIGRCRVVSNEVK